MLPESSMLPEVAGDLCSYHIIHIVLSGRPFPLPTRLTIPSYIFVVSASLSRI